MTKLAIHSVPRSGSTWLGEIFNSSPHVVYRYQPLFSYAFKGRINEESSREDINTFFCDIAKTDDRFTLQLEKREIGVLPTFRKYKPRVTAYKEVRYHYVIERLITATNDVRVVGLIRNPLSSINSWLQAPREFRRDLGWDELEEWRSAPLKNAGRREEYNGFDKWVEVAHMFRALCEEYPDRFYLVHYRDLVARTHEVVESLFAWVGLPLTDQTLHFLEESATRTIDHAYSVFRSYSTDDQWKDHLDPRIVQAIVGELKGTDLEYLLDLTSEEIQSIVDPEIEARHGRFTTAEK